MEKALIVLKKIANLIKAEGGNVYYVGGFVRDKLIGKDNKDIDVEVFGIRLPKLKEILSQFGIVDEIGTSFGILMVHGLPIDFSLPRREQVAKLVLDEKKLYIPIPYETDVLLQFQKNYPNVEIIIDKQMNYGHKDFIVVPDPFMSLQEATMRRDFTMNALMEHVLTGELIDFWGGREDILTKQIRYINKKTFQEDALRVLRACQFASRFEFQITEETKQLCQTIDLHVLPKERIFEELKKAFVKSDKPSIALESMKELHVIDKLFPELKALIDCPQDPIHHPEGTVWIHLKLVMDLASKLKHKASNQVIFMFGVLGHDMGKATTTKVENGRITSKGHDVEGAEVVEKFMKRLTTKKSLIEGVKNLTLYHMRPMSLYPNATDKAIRKLSMKTNIHDILLLAEADYKGKGLIERDFTEIANWFHDKIRLLQVDKKIEKLVTGRDLLDRGLLPGKEMGRYIQEAFDYQLDGLNKDEILDKLFESKQVSTK